MLKVSASGRSPDHIVNRSTAGPEPSPERLPIDQRPAFDTASEASGNS